REAGADVLARTLGPAPEVARLLVRRYEDALFARTPRLAAAA
ncbi:sirohydrochlorin chelatase, partial [Streptomyces sp. SID11385]|nr:sirohydrochlorin chelatase [Streptomyces sp. SID11385]